MFEPEFLQKKSSQFVQEFKVQQLSELASEEQVSGGKRRASLLHSHIQQYPSFRSQHNPLKVTCILHHAACVPAGIMEHFG